MSRNGAGSHVANPPGAPPHLQESVPQHSGLPLETGGSDWAWRPVSETDEPDAIAWFG